MKNLVGWWTVAALAAVGMMNSAANAQLTEGFEVVNTLDPSIGTDGVVISGAMGDWIGALRSRPLGLTGTFQGNDAVFAAHMGPTTSYLGMNFNNCGDDSGGGPGSGFISTWVMSPEVVINNGDVVSFWTRTPTGSIWPDRLELRMSTNGASTFVGNTDMTVGDFTTVLTVVNPNLEQFVYPEEWTEFSATVSGLGGPTTGRFAFRYLVDMAGPSGVNSNYIGIDTFTHTPATGGCAPPASYTVFRGIQRSGDLGSFADADGNVATFNPGFTINNTEAPVWLVFDANAPNATDISVTSTAGTPGIGVRAECWNWSTSTYVQVGAQEDETFNVQTKHTFGPIDAACIDGSGNVRWRIGWRKKGFTINYPWLISVDATGACN